MDEIRATATQATATALAAMPKDFAMSIHESISAAINQRIGLLDVNAPDVEQ